EVSRRVYAIRLLARLNEERRPIWILVIDESWHSKNACGVGRGSIAAKLICEHAEKRLCLFQADAVDLPHDLMLGSRRVQDKVGSRYVKRVADVSKRQVGVFIQVEVHVPDFAYALLCSAGGAI